MLIGYVDDFLSGKISSNELDSRRSVLAMHANGGLLRIYPDADAQCVCREVENLITQSRSSDWGNRKVQDERLRVLLEEWYKPRIPMAKSCWEVC